MIGYTGDNVENYAFKTWQPGVWNSICMTYDGEKQEMKININEKNVLESNSYTIKYQGGHNIVLMNDGAFWGGSPMHGKVTDVNVWRRVLTDKEIHHWEECKSSEGGDLINWETARFNLTAGITESVEDKEKYICFHKTSGKIYKTIKSKETFDGGIKYCNTIGAEVATADDASSLKVKEDLLLKSSTFSAGDGGELQEELHLLRPVLHRVHRQEGEQEVGQLQQPAAAYTERLGRGFSQELHST